MPARLVERRGNDNAYAFPNCWIAQDNGCWDCEDKEMPLTSVTVPIIYCHLRTPARLPILIKFSGDMDNHPLRIGLKSTTTPFSCRLLNSCQKVMSFSYCRHRPDSNQCPKGERLCLPLTIFLCTYLLLLIFSISENSHCITSLAPADHKNEI